MKLMAGRRPARRARARRLAHYQTHQVVDQGDHAQFLVDAVHGLAAQHVQVQRVCA